MVHSPQRSEAMLLESWTWTLTPAGKWEFSPCAPNLESFVKLFGTSYHWLQRCLNGVYRTNTQEKCHFVALVSCRAGEECSLLPAVHSPLKKGAGHAGVHMCLEGQPPPPAAASLGCLPRGICLIHGCVYWAPLEPTFSLPISPGSTASGLLSPLPGGWSPSSHLQTSASLSPWCTVTYWLSAGQTSR